MSSIRSKNQPEEFRKLAREWAEALDVIHEKTFIGAGPHPELEAFQALEKRLHDAALKGN